MGEIQQYQHHQPPEQSEQSQQPQQQPQPVFEQWQQPTNFQFFNHANLQYNYNNYNYHPQQPQQIFPQFQNIQTNHHGSSPSHLHFHPQQNLELEQQQRRLQLENHHYQQPFFSRDNNNNNNNHNNNNSRGFIITGDGSSIIPIPSTPSYLNGNFRCRNDNDVTAFRFTSLARPSHFWRKSGHDINEADENDKHSHEEEMNQNQKQNCGHTCTSSPAAIISLPPPPPPTISKEFIINNLIAQKAGKRVVNEEVQQKMQPSLSTSTVADHDDRKRRKRNRKRRKRSRERDEKMEWMQTFAKQVVESMEAFHMKFCEMIEKLEKDRKERDEYWRRREMENFQSQFSVSSKSHIENRALPTMAPPTTRDDSSIVAQTIHTERIILSGIGGGSSSKRWPEEEVGALIELRMNLAERFQERGLKWPLWEEISNRMSSMGFHHRDAKRCKEKWDNIIKYYKKLQQQQQQDGRRQKLKTCVYFDKLDQFYNSNSSSIDNGGCYGGGNVDLQQSQ